MKSEEKPKAPNVAKAWKKAWRTVWDTMRQKYADGNPRWYVVRVIPPKFFTPRRASQDDLL